MKAVQNSRPSLPIIHIKTKIKNPWNPLKITNRYWNAVDDSLTVRAPKSHVRPSNATIPIMLIINLTVDRSDFFFFLLCMSSTRTTSAKMIVLNTKSTNMGAKRVTKNTVGSLMKQLWRKISASINHKHLLKVRLKLIR